MKNSLLRVALESIPSHRERPQSYAALTQRVADRAGLPDVPAASALRTALELLRLLDLIQDSDEHIALSDQTRTYFRNSLVWYLENDQEIVSNWDRHGTAQEEISIANLLDQAPFLLKALEERRLRISKEFNIPPSASREQTCSVVLFKTIFDGVTYLLHQWDQKAERYQLIGGKQRADESYETTAAREVLEELRNANLVPEKTLFISKCRITPVEYWDISRTYGALTKYDLHVFNAIVTQRELKTSESDLWISLQEALDGRTFSGAPIAPLVQHIARRDQGFFDSLPLSLEIHGDWRRSVRIAKPAETAAVHLESEPPEHLSIDRIGPQGAARKVFLSHASSDVDLAEEVVDLLEAIGVPQQAIFCSSLAGYGISLGENFLEAIKAEFAGSTLVIFLLTQRFYSSPVSLCEMGAAWIRAADHIPIVVPPLDFPDIKGVIPLSQGMKINDPLQLNQLKQRIEAAFGLKTTVGQSAWERKRDRALARINKSIAGASGRTSDA